MTAYTLTLLEATGIQEYVFASNNLAVNIGASELVERVTGAWLHEALPGRHNLRVANEEVQYVEQAAIDRDGLDAEVIYRGGGNGLILFAGRSKAERFTRTSRAGGRPVPGAGG